MKIRILTLCAVLTGCATPSPDGGPPAPAPSRVEAVAGPDVAALEAELRMLVADFDGRAGVYVRHLGTGAEIAVAADAVYPTASMVKVPLLVGLYEAAESGRLDLESRLAYHDSLHYESDSDLANKLRAGSEVSMWQLAVLMVVLSDNTASLWLQGLVTGDSVNAWLAEHGFVHTRVNSRVEGRRPNWEEYGWGQSTPREMARLLVMIRRGEAVSPTASDAMYRLLSRSYWPLGAAATLPAAVNVAAKYGAVSAAKSEALLVNAPGGDYVVVVMTADQEDTRWAADNEGYALIRTISDHVYETFAGDR